MLIPRDLLIKEAVVPVKQQARWLVAAGRLLLFINLFTHRSRVRNDDFFDFFKAHGLFYFDVLSLLSAGSLSMKNTRHEFCPLTKLRFIRLAFHLNLVRIDIARRSEIFGPLDEDS